MKHHSNKPMLIGLALLISSCLFSQNATISGKVTSNNESLEFVNIMLQGTEMGAITDLSGAYRITNIKPGTYKLIASSIGYKKEYQSIALKSGDALTVNFELTEENSELNEVVITGTMKEVSKLESPVPVEVYAAKFFKSNPVPAIFDALQNVNGVRPQLNCNVCNTGDIHINGLEGPYTMVLIDGMPIVSGLSSVYGLSGIPQSLVERVEIVKGPASTLYGSEAVGGLINIITKQPINAPLLSVDVFGTTWGEVNTDIAAKFNITKKAQSLLGVNYYNYQNPIDNNNDNFTDVTLQNRISIFNKWNFSRKDNRLFSVVGRYVYEDRWGGEMNWTSQYRGGNEIYGESIYTSRWELFGNYELPLKDRVMLQFSFNGHDQNSVYGDMPYVADQKIAFGQLTWNKELGKHDLLTGLTYRYTYYDDDTPATANFNNPNVNQASHTNLPGLFVQDEIWLNENNKLLLGMRYDYNSIHGSILTPRINYKWNSKDKNNVLRFSLGNGYRVANVFTEDHAALTGAREVEFLSDLKPEKSWNGNINFVKKIYTANGTFIGLDATAFYTHFNNKIIADYDTDPNKIIYDNLDGHAISQGISFNMDMALANGLKILLGATAMDVYSKENGERIQQLFTEKITGVWNLGYTFEKAGLNIDYTGNLYGPMRLPLLSDTDPRQEYSPYWSIQNIQLTKTFNNGLELYGGVKNLLDWTPNKGNPFIIARADDPFDKNVQFDADGQAMVTPDNPYGLTFDPSYVYGPNQGIRGFLGLRWSIN
ncbi:TonB-dependent receptor [Arenibacter aquaticus]|uniref:TonB-dependent receptor n=1 Tax=Arenibacter aquaticus TaxID=2489054 RepID=A0A3S0ACN5_9FLAO|nr:TonB-dependent receptor [Arenibacter aquaticus]RTE52433.1 TonB-dependent receptor [Arenibacter aquaticus]